MAEALLVSVSTKIFANIETAHFVRPFAHLESLVAGSSSVLSALRGVSTWQSWDTMAVPQIQQSHRRIKFASPLHSRLQLKPAENCPPVNLEGQPYQTRKLLSLFQDPEHTNRT